MNMNKHKCKCRYVLHKRVGRCHSLFDFVRHFTVLSGIVFFVIDEIIVVEGLNGHR